MCGRQREDHVEYPADAFKQSVPDALLPSARPRLIRDARRAPGARGFRGGARDCGGDATRGMAGSGVRLANCCACRAEASRRNVVEQPSYRHGTSIVVLVKYKLVGRGLRAERARSIRARASWHAVRARLQFAQVERPQDRWPLRASSADAMFWTAVAPPSPRSHIYENGDTSAEMRAASSWRPCATV